MNNQILRPYLTKYRHKKMSLSEPSLQRFIQFFLFLKFLCMSNKHYTCRYTMLSMFSCKSTFKWTSTQRWQCPIHNGTLKECVYIKYELDMNVYSFENCSFQIVFLRIPTNVTCAFRSPTAGKIKQKHTPFATLKKITISSTLLIR